MASLGGIEHLRCAHYGSISLKKPMASHFNPPYVFGSCCFIFKFEINDVTTCFSRQSADHSDADTILLGYLALETVLHSHSMGNACQVSC